MNNQRLFLLLLLFLCGLASTPMFAQAPNSGVSGIVQFDGNNDCIPENDSFFYFNSVVAFQNGDLIAGGTVGIQGQYFIPLAPGTYHVTYRPTTSAFEACGGDTLTVTVAAADTTENVDFIIQYNPLPVTSISGYVYNDIDGDCVHDAFETGVAGWPVLIRVQSLGLVQNYYDTTDVNGYYELLNPPSVTTAGGGYVIVNEPPNNGLSCFFPCNQEVVLNYPNGPAFEGNFAVHCDTLLPCPRMDVSIGTNQLRPCLPAYYNVNYCNIGGATAKDAYIVVTLDSALVFTSSSIPGTALGGNVYSFPLGDLGVEQCGGFNIIATVPCNEPLGTTYCVEAHAYPDSSCAPSNAQWDGSEVQVTADCDGENVVFTITNVGLGDMQHQLNYIVIEDNILMMSTPPGGFQLAAGESTTVTVPTTGSFLRLQADQSPGFIGQNTPVAWAEGCNGAGTVSLGYVNQYPLGDEEPFLDVFCLESVNSFDPNDKNGFPRGVKEEHFIDQNVEMEYIIRFQNTGTAPALDIEIRDTLSASFDPTTVRPGASSHSYQWDMQGDGVVVFKFADINLPDSAASQINSQGFVQFRVQQRKDVAIGTRIENTAAIYFDNNAPVITNQTFHTIGKEFVVSATSTVLVPNVYIQIAPNPLTNQARVSVEGLDNTDKMNFRLYSTVGKSVLNSQFSGSSFEFQAAQLPAGVYFYEIRSAGKAVGQGKLVKM